LNSAVTGFSDTIIPPGTYSPGSTVTFTQKISVGSAGAFTIESCGMILKVEEA